MLALLTSSSQTNILRPATAIIRKLVASSPQSVGKGVANRIPKASSIGKGKEKAENTEGVGGARCGFDQVYKRMEAMGPASVNGVSGARRVLTVVVKRLEGTGDLELVAGRRACLAD